MSIQKSIQREWSYSSQELQGSWVKALLVVLIKLEKQQKQSFSSSFFVEIQIDLNFLNPTSLGLGSEARSPKPNFICTEWKNAAERANFKGKHCVSSETPQKSSQYEKFSVCLGSHSITNDQMTRHLSLIAGNYAL